jgi:Family of unknown function (DUF6169)
MYPFSKGTKPDVYNFFTKEAIIYEVSFVKVQYFDEYPLFANDVYEVIIQLFSDSKNFAPYDSWTAPTIASIIATFLDSPYKILVYNCDTSDGREKVRNRKFDEWFQKYSANHYIKLDSNFYDLESNITFFSTLIMKRDNPYKFYISEAFDELTDRLGDKE